MNPWVRWKRWLQFNLWYLGSPPWDTGISPPELLAFIQSRPAGRALDLGCGSGVNLLTLAQAGWQVTGVDFALPAVRRAKERLRRSGFVSDVRMGDVTRLEDLPGPFDLVLDIGCYHGLPTQSRPAYQANLQRWLPLEATFLLYAHIQSEAQAPGPGVSLVELEQMAEQFSNHERVVGVDRWGRQTAWLRYVR